MASSEPSDIDLLHIAIGERIAMFRRSRHISQLVLGKLIGLNEQYAGRLERGDASPSLATLATVAAAFGVTVQRLIEVDAHDLDLAAIKFANRGTRKRTIKPVAEAVVLITPDEEAAAEG